jgi:hypothetical protein
MRLATAQPSGDGTGQPSQREATSRRVNPWIPPDSVLYSLAKRLFPGMPRLVRERKMRILCLVTMLVLGLCTTLILALWLANQVPSARWPLG